VCYFVCVVLLFVYVLYTAIYIKMRSRTIKLKLNLHTVHTKPLRVEKHEGREECYVCETFLYVLFSSTTLYYRHHISASRSLL